MLQEVNRVMERSFQSALQEFQNLKGISSSYISVMNAWEYIAKDDAYEAYWLAKQAFIRRPKLIFFISYLNLIFLMAFKRSLRPRNYNALHSLLFGWKQVN